MEYSNLMKDNQQKKVWKHYFLNELGMLAQVIGKIVEVMDTIFSVDYKYIPSERRSNITYVRVVVD